VWGKVEGLNKESDAKKQEMIQVIDTTVDTVQDLLLISRIETGISKSSKKVNVSLVVNELAELARSLVQDRTVRVTDNVQNDVKFNGDERLIKKAFGNIVHNAVQYVGETGEINLLLKTDGLNLIFEVMNSGKGIRSNELDHVFERFYRGSNAQINPKGSGLGLAITKAVVESLLGKIEIKSDNLKTSVRLVIPLQ
jgi:signal transduction histidine kinase